MKKVMLLAGVICFVLASCCSKEDKCAKEEATDTTCAKGEACCKHMTEEQKQAIADWEDWVNIDDARKEVLLQDRKAKYDQCKVEREKRKAEMEAIDAKMSDWDNLTIDDKKVLFDEFDQFAKAGKHHGDKEGCCSKDKK